MRIALNATTVGSAGCAKYWGENTYKKMKEFGYSCVDNGLPCRNDILEMDPEERKKLLTRERKLAEEAGLRIHQAHGPVLSMERALTEEENAGLLEKIKIAIECCTYLGCEYLVVHPFMPNGWSDRGTEIAKDTFEKNVAYLRELSDYAKPYGVTLCYETMPCIGFCISTPEEVAEVVRAVDRDNVKICLDIGHVTAFSRRLDVGPEMRKCGDLIKVLHVHDNYGSTDQHNLPGMGMIKWWDVMAALREINFDGVFSLELNFPNGFAEPIMEQYCRLAFNMANEIANGVKA